MNRLFERKFFYLSRRAWFCWWFWSEENKCRSH